MWWLSAKPKRGRPKKRPKVLKDVLSDAYLSTLKKDPELLKEIAFRDAGHADVLERDRGAENQKKEIRKFVTSEALKKIKEDPELAEQFIEAQIADILSEGKSARARRATEPEFYGESGSAIAQAVEEIDNIELLRDKLGRDKGKGLLSAFTDPEVIKGFLALLSGVRAGAPQSPVRTYVVRVNGEEREIPEAQYRKLIQEGSLRPVAELEMPKVKKEVEEPIKEPEYPQLPDFLKGIDLPAVSEWLELTPQDFVTQLKVEVDTNVEQSKLIWGFLSTADYDGIVALITPYRSNPEVSESIEKILSDEGRKWVSEVLQLVKECQK